MFGAFPPSIVVGVLPWLGTPLATPACGEWIAKESSRACEIIAGLPACCGPLKQRKALTFRVKAVKRHFANNILPGPTPTFSGAKLPTKAA